MEMKRVIIKNDRTRSLERRHPWIFSRAVIDKEGCEDGDIVEVYNKRGQHLGVGYWQDGSIMVRMLSFERANIDGGFWLTRLRAALELRKHIGLPNSSTDAYRLIHGEGDQLPGLIIDIYGSVAVVQCHTIGIHKRVRHISDALEELYGPELKSIYCKSGSTLPGDYAAAHPDYHIKGDAKEIIIQENGHQFYIDIVGGQKTGFFLDQRDNRYLLGQYAQGKNILNLYSYTGGFSIYGLNNGAAKVTSVDISEKAVQICERNASLTDDELRHEGVKAHVHQYLKSLDEEVHDIIIVDPPAFAKSVRKRHNAIQAYKRINAMAMKKVKPGGLIFTFSCSQVVDTPMFYNTIVSAAIEARRPCQVLARLSQGADHPVSIYHPEGSYLKGLLVKVT